VGAERGDEGESGPVVSHNVPSKLKYITRFNHEYRFNHQDYKFKNRMCKFSLKRISRIFAMHLVFSHIVNIISGQSYNLNTILMPKQRTFTSRKRVFRSELPGALVSAAFGTATNVSISSGSNG
jgi:hypothetical protein